MKSENQSISKKEKMEYHPDADLLSHLPSDIIHSILQFVPIRDAVKTSILSRKWRYKWTSLPQLVFDNKCVSPEDKSKSKFEDFITRVLFRHKGPIHRFKMSCPFVHTSPNIDEWVFFLSRNGIKELILDTNYDDSSSFTMHSSVYSCKKLTYLELFMSELDPPPWTFKGFLFLKCLILNRVDLSRKGIETLVSICPLLERFELIEFGESELKISAPNLKYFNLAGSCIKVCLYAPLLAEISVELNLDLFIAELQQQKTSVCNYTNFLGGFPDLEKLSGSCDFTQYLRIGIESCHHSLVFHHLKLIELHQVNFEDAKELSVLARLLNGTPNLSELNIIADYFIRRHDASDSEAPQLSSMDFGFAPNLKLEKLRVVTMMDLTGFPLEIEFLKFLLESSPVLEKMSVDTTNLLGTEEKQKIRAELLGCSWASPIVKLWMMNRYSSPASPVLLLQSEEGSTK